MQPPSLQELHAGVEAWRVLVLGDRLGGLPLLQHCLHSRLDRFRHTKCTSAAILPASCLACSRHTKRICTMLKCVGQINLLGQLALWRAVSTLWSKYQSSSLCWALAQPLVEAT